jgi:AcrR family transcriptional regulator
VGEERKPGVPRSKKGEQTRARILEAAKRVFEDQGFIDARISDIAERAGMSHGSFYHYFESKDEVFAEVVGALQESQSLHSVIDSGLLDGNAGSMHDRLRASIRRALEDYRDEARLMAVVEQVSRHHEQVRATRTERQRVYGVQAVESIRRLQRMGLADPDLDPAIASAALSGMVNRFAEMWLVQGLIDCDFDDAVEQITTLCMSALGLRERARVVAS